MIFLTAHTTANIILVIFNLLVGGFLILRPGRTTASFHLGLGFIFMAVFPSGYVFGTSLYHPIGAFHRYMTVSFVVPLCMQFGQFFLRYPANEHRRGANALLAVGWIVSASLSIYFILSTFAGPVEFEFSSGVFNFVADRPTRVVGLVILAAVVHIIFVLGYRILRKDPESKFLTALAALLIGSSFPTAIVNYLVTLGYFDRGFFFNMFIFNILTFFFVFVILYINHTHERSTFMAKLVGITVVTVLLLVQSFSYYTFGKAERSFDETMLEQSIRLASDPRQTGVDSYVATMEPLGNLRWSSLAASPDIEMTKNAIANARWIETLRQNTATPAERPDSFLLYDAILAERQKTSPNISTEDLIGELVTLDAPLSGLRRGLEVIPVSEFDRRAPELIRSFRDKTVATRLMQAMEDGPASEHKNAVTRLLSPALPILSRRYAEARTADVATRERFVTYVVRNPNGEFAEVAFPYLLYRSQIHNTAKFVLLELGAAILVILFLYPLFFRGSLINPLRTLISGVQRVNSGDLSVSVPVRIEDEIGFLSRSFNNMVTSIRDARDNLEQKIHDRTEDLQKALDKLREADQIKTNFFANVSHELRTPLTLMLAPLESMRAGEVGPLTPIGASFVDSMLKNGEKLLKLITNLLDYSKLEAGRMQLNYGDAEMVAYVRELVSSFDSAARTRGLFLEVHTAAPQIRAQIDPDKMEKIILNLLSNAFKFTQEGGISLYLSEENGIVQIVVKDTGIGIPEEKLQTIFERFSQVDASASRKYEGTGIGLALARELAILHGGDLSVTSRVGTGSEFVIRFPASGEGKADLQTVTNARPHTARAGVLAEVELETESVNHDPDTTVDLATQEVQDTRLVLIVEDTHDMRKLLYFFLKPHFRVVTARNGREGLEKARTHRPALIVSDVMMPEMSGYDLLRAVRAEEELKTTPLILLTARADINMKVEGLDQGADDYLVKPFNSRELLSRIRAQLRIQAMQDEIRTMRDRLLEVNEQLSGKVTEQASEIFLKEKFRNYLPPQLVDAILSREGDAQVRSTRKKLSIFFSDIVQFTRITGELEPEDIARLLNHYLSEMTKIARKHNGTVDKFIGDAVLIHFGDHGSRGEKQDAIDCVQMAIDMQLRMRELSAEWIEQGFEEPFQIRCGINTGYAAVGNFGSEDRLDYTIIGSNVNLASRIQSNAEPGHILISHATWALARDHFRLEPRDNIAPKGFNRTIPVYAVKF